MLVMEVVRYASLHTALFQLEKVIKSHKSSFLLQCSPNLVERSLFASFFRIFHYFVHFFTMMSPFDPQKGSGGQMEVKSQFCSNFHQIWWKEAFLQVIQGSLSKTLILIRFFCIFHLSPSICLKFYYKRPLNLIIFTTKTLIGE